MGSEGGDGGVGAGKRGGSQGSAGHDPFEWTRRSERNGGAGGRADREVLDEGMFGVRMR